MPRFFLKLSFKGTSYAGWQIQDNAISVQEKLNESVSVLTGLNILTTGCGRTDTGVHATQFYAHFDLPEVISEPGRFIYQLNAILPNDITVHEVIPVADENHARFDATSRTYKYFICKGKNSFLKDFVLQMNTLPDLEKIKLASNFILGKHDFSSFSKSNTQVKTNICTISHATWEFRNELLVFTITADRFLRGMVRAVVGTLFEAGYGNIPPEQIVSILSQKNRSQAGASVAACGLYLCGVRYPFIPASDSPPFPA